MSNDNNNEKISPADYIDEKRELVQWLLINDASDTMHSAEYPLSVLRDRVAHIKQQRSDAAAESFESVADELDGATLPELDDETIAAEQREQERFELKQRAKQLAPSASRERVVTVRLGDYDIEVLLNVSTKGWLLPERNSEQSKASQWLGASLVSDGVHPLITWVDRHGRVQTGVVRQRFEHGDEPSFDASPFPGAWERVLLSQIIVVRHPETI